MNFNILIAYFCEADIKKLCPEAKLQDGLAVIGGQVKRAKPVLEKWLKRNRLI